MAKDEPANFILEDAHIIFRNFEGKEGQYNRKGSRNFAVIIPDEKTAQQMLKDGWNVKYLEAREEGDEPVPYVSVEVSYKNRPPRVVMLTASSKSRTNLGEDEIEILDYADIQKVDLICNAYEWDINGKQGVKAYLKTMFVTIEEDELERKYAIEQAED
jgi:hypothetical protein